MLTLLQEKCQKAELNIEDYVLSSKNGFTSQLTQMKNAEMTLLSQSHLSSLLDDLAKDDLLAYKNKKY